MQKQFITPIWLALPNKRDSYTVLGLAHLALQSLKALSQAIGHREFIIVLICSRSP